MIKVQKIGIVGDIHGEAQRLQRVLNFFQSLQLDRILSVGDIVDGQGDVNKCCQLLEEHQVITIRGNHDLWLIASQGVRKLKGATQKAELSERSLQYLYHLPPTYTLESPQGNILLCHGIGDYDLKSVKPDDEGYALDSNFELWDVVHSRQYRYMINGHIHQRMVRTFEDLTVINAGTLKSDQAPCCGVIDFLTLKVQFYDIEDNLEIVASDQFDL